MAEIENVFGRNYWHLLQKGMAVWRVKNSPCVSSLTTLKGNPSTAFHRVAKTPRAMPVKIRIILACVSEETGRRNQMRAFLRKMALAINTIRRLTARKEKN